MDWKRQGYLLLSVVGTLPCNDVHGLETITGWFGSIYGVADVLFCFLLSFLSPGSQGSIGLHPFSD